MYTLQARALWITIAGFENSSSRSSGGIEKAFTSIRDTGKKDRACGGERRGDDEHDKGDRNEDVDNYEIKIEESNLAASKENVTQSISNYFPSISFQGSISENEVAGIKSQTGSTSPGYDLEPSVASITITQNLFNGLGKYHSLINGTL